jgi:ABC-type transport system involved in multi-copper enzyme maturation permease subunit
VDSVNLLREIIQRLSKRKILILITGIVFAICSFLIARSIKTEYTSKATIFPLSNPSDNPLSSSGGLGGLLGISSAANSFSSEASINIIELALSRTVREDAAATRIPEYGNKTVAEILVQQYNNNCSFFSKKIEWPDDSTERAVLGGNLLAPDIAAKINKNGVLELNYTNTDKGLVKPISDILIGSISQFYINLRIAKATADYNFTLLKIDSLQKVLDQLDARTIHAYNTTLFTPADKVDYSLPKENLADEKMLVTQQRNVNINNREEALWRLQKITPIIATLDKPNPPFSIQKASAIIYAIVGFIIGTIIAVLCLIAGLL